MSTGVTEYPWRGLSSCDPDQNRRGRAEEEEEEGDYRLRQAGAVMAQTDVSPKAHWTYRCVIVFGETHESAVKQVTWVPVCHLFRLVASHLTGLHTSWIIPSHPADFFFYFLFFFFSFFFSILPARVFSCPPGGRTTAAVLSSSTFLEVFFSGSSSLLSRPVLSVQTAGSLRCSDPPVRCCLRRPTLTPCSFFLRTRKRLALLTPSRGLALAGLEKRPPGWAGHMGGREGGMGGGSGSGAIGQRRCLSRREARGGPVSRPRSSFSSSSSSSPLGIMA